MHGMLEPKISLGLNCIRGWNPHKVTIDFDDGDSYSFTISKLIINGMLFGDRTFNFEDASIFGLILDYVVGHKSLVASEIFYGKNPNSEFKGKNQNNESVSAVIYELKAGKKI